VDEFARVVRQDSDRRGPANVQRFWILVSLLRPHVRSRPRFDRFQIGQRLGAELPTTPLCRGMRCPRHWLAKCDRGGLAGDCSAYGVQPWHLGSSHKIFCRILKPFPDAFSSILEDIYSGWLYASCTIRDRDLDAWRADLRDAVSGLPAFPL